MNSRQPTTCRTNPSTEFSGTSCVACVLPAQASTTSPRRQQADVQHRGQHARATAMILPGRRSRLRRAPKRENRCVHESVCSHGRRRPRARSDRSDRPSRPGIVRVRRFSTCVRAAAATSIEIQLGRGARRNRSVSIAFGYLLAIVLVEAPATAHRLIALHQHVQTPALVLVEVGHEPALAGRTAARLWFSSTRVQEHRRIGSISSSIFRPLRRAAGAGAPADDRADLGHQDSAWSCTRPASAASMAVPQRITSRFTVGCDILHRACRRCSQPRSAYRVMLLRCSRSFCRWNRGRVVPHRRRTADPRSAPRGRGRSRIRDGLRTAGGGRSEGLGWCPLHVLPDSVVNPEQG